MFIFFRVDSTNFSEVTFKARFKILQVPRCFLAKWNDLIDEVNRPENSNT